MMDAEINPTTDAHDPIQREQKRLQDTLNAANIGTWRWDFASDLYTADALTMRFFDIKPEQVAPNDDTIYRARIHPDDLAAVDAALLRTAHFGDQYDHSYRVIHTDGTIHWVQGRGHLEFDSAGKSLALIGTAMDITEFKNTQEALRHSEEKYRSLIENVDQGYCLCQMIFDENGHGVDHRFLEVNPAFEIMSGVSNAAGKLASEVIPGLEKWFSETYGIVSKTGIAVRFQHGSKTMGRVFDVFASPNSDDHVILLFSDITQRVRREEQMEALNIRLRRAMAETHHRVKNNLQVIASLVEMQVSEMESDTTTVPLKRIKQHIQSLAVIHDLLTEEATADGDTDYIGTQSILDRLLPTLEMTIGHRCIIAETEDVTLTVQKAASFSLLVSECISNALKHAKGDIKVTLTQKNAMATLEIRDDGNGFPADFDPRKASNTGLQLIESAARWDLSGDVKYDNHPKGGGRVTITFPVD